MSDTVKVIVKQPVGMYMPDEVVDLPESQAEYLIKKGKVKLYDPMAQKNSGNEILERLDNALFVLKKFLPVEKSIEETSIDYLERLAEIIRKKAEEEKANEEDIRNKFLYYMADNLPKDVIASLKNAEKFSLESLTDITESELIELPQIDVFYSTRIKELVSMYEE